jgi:hypothetical protein
LLGRPADHLQPLNHEDEDHGGHLGAAMIACTPATDSGSEETGVHDQGEQRGD